MHFRVPALPMGPDELALAVAQAVLDFIANNPPLWESWKKKREGVAVEAAARMNPSATAAAGVGFGADKDKGSIQYVSLQDIQNGKVSLPGGGMKMPKDDAAGAPGADASEPFQ